MYHMYDVGERFIAEVVTCRKVGDIIIFKLPSRKGREGRSWIFGEGIFIKRVVGVAGHTLLRGMPENTWARISSMPGYLNLAAA
jgi:hypothetical protein